MQSKAKTVAEYLASLPADRRAALEIVRKTILANLDAGFEEGMQYGMIGYYVPHSRFPPGYHCDPKQPLPFAGLASQKGHMSVYLMSLYGTGESEETWFRKAWQATGKKLDMGKCCVRFKKLEDLALDVVAEAFRRTSADAWVDYYQRVMDARTNGGPRSAAKPKPPAKPKATAKGAPKKAAPKKVARKVAKKR